MITIDKPQVHADLRTAAEILQRDGWITGSLHQVVGGKVCHCADGALYVATGAHINLRPVLHGVMADAPEDEEVRNEAYARWERADTALQTHVGGSVPAWNDAPGQTAEKVIAGLLAAAEELEDANGHCDTCGALCDADGCTTDRNHLAAIDPTEV